MIREIEPHATGSSIAHSGICDITCCHFGTSLNVREAKHTHELETRSRQRQCNVGPIRAECRIPRARLCLPGALARFLHRSGCLANTAWLSERLTLAAAEDLAATWTKDPQAHYKLLLADQPLTTSRRLLLALVRMCFHLNFFFRRISDIAGNGRSDKLPFAQNLGQSPLQAQMGTVCDVSLEPDAGLELTRPLEAFRSLSCCRILNVGFAAPQVPPHLLARRERGPGFAVTLHTAQPYRTVCSACGFLRGLGGATRNDHGYEFLESVNGAHIQVSTVNNTPYVVLGDWQPGFGFRKQEGVEMVQLKILSQVFNFTYSLSVSSGDYGSLRNGHWTGLIGKVLRKESDLALSEISFEMNRTSVVSYQYPAVFDVISFVARAPGVTPFAFAIIRPFDGQIWLSVALSLLVGSLLLEALRLSPAESGPGDRPNFWFLLSTLGRQNAWQGEHESPGYRLFLGPWWLYVLVMTTLYSGRLVAFMSVPVYEPSIRNLEQLEDAIRHKGFKLCTHRQTIFIEYIRMARSGALNEVRLRQMGDESSLLVSDRRTGLLWALKYPYAYMDSKMSILSGMSTLLDAKDALRLHVADDNMGVEYCGAVFQKDCPLREQLNAASRVLFETGHLTKWLSQAMRRLDEVTEDPRLDFHQRRENPLSASDFNGSFYLLGAGFVVAAAALGLEMCCMALRDRMVVYYRPRTVLKKSGLRPLGKPRTDRDLKVALAVR
ncbi:glutamate receptor ionotropic, delta-1 [Ixodes scapularis]